jgi:hypothetical protein
MRILVVLILSALPGFSTPLRACGFCGGDKAASVYSFRHQRFAKQSGARYVSVELIGKGGEAEFKRVIEALKRIHGVYPKTVLSAYAQKAASFVYQPAIRFEDLAHELSERARGWSMKLVEEIK